MHAFILVLFAGLALAEPPLRQLPDAGPRPGLPRVAVTRSCADIEADARALVDDAQGCAGSCAVVSFAELLGPDTCVAAFQCATSLPAELDRAAFVVSARALIEEKRDCGECATAACRPPEDLAATCVDGACELVPRASAPNREPPPAAR